MVSKSEIASLDIPKKYYDEKYEKIDEILKSPTKSPLKKIEKVITKAGELKLENVVDSKRKLQIKQNFLDDLDSQEVFCVRFDPDDTLLASSFADGTIKIYNMNTGKMIINMNGSLYNTPTTILRWRPKGISSKTKNILISGNSDGNISHWHATSGKLLKRDIEIDNQILAMDYNIDGSLYATGGKDMKIRIYDEESEEIIQTLESIVWGSSGPANRIFSLKFLNDDPNILLSGGWDGNIFFWDIREKNSIGAINGPALSGDSLDYKKSIILTGSHRSQNQLQLWDFKQRQKIQDIEWEKDKKNEAVHIYGAQFCKVNDESIFAGSSGKNEVKLFDTKDNMNVLSCVSGMKKGVYSIDYGNSTNRLAFGGADGVTYTLALTSF